MSDSDPSQRSRLDQARRPGLLIASACLAVVALLARHPDGRSMLPSWLEMVLQVPAVIAWAHFRCGWFTQPSRRALSPDGACAQRRASSVACSVDRKLTLFVAAGAMAIGAAYDQPLLFFTGSTVFISASLLLDGLQRVYRRIDAACADPRRLFGVFWPSWLGLILAASLLLSLPLATHSAIPDYAHNFWSHVLNSAFAAVSSACLVGTFVYSFAEDYTTFGQAVVVVTGQLAAICFCAIGLAAMRPFLNHPLKLRTVLAWAFGLQLLAVLVLAANRLADPAGAATRGLWSEFVLAGSALWNTGILPRTAGLATDLAAGPTLACLVTLSIMGSLGVPVMLDLIRRRRREATATVARPAGSRVPPRSASAATGHPLPCRRLPQYQATATLVLLVVGAVLLFYFETPRALPPALVPARPFDLGENQVALRDRMGRGRRWNLAVFVSVTSRSTGMQCVPVSQGAISWPSYGVLLIWMFIGGSIAGTAGGVRLSAFLLPAIGLLYAGEDWRASVGGTAVRRLLLRRVPLFIGLWMGVNVLAVVALRATTQASSYETLFDSIAAVNGVGLSTGLAPHLTAAGRVVMILLFMGGRLIPAAFWLLLAHRITTCLGPDPARRAARS